MTLSLLPLFILVKTFEKGSQRGARIIQDNRDTVSGKKKKACDRFFRCNFKLSEHHKTKFDSPPLYWGGSRGFRDGSATTLKPVACGDF